MARLIGRIAALFAELRRRRVFRAAGLYLVAAWAVIEVTATVFPLLFVPVWVIRAVTVLAVLGFPVVLVLAWAFDLTPEGLERAPASEPPISPSRARMILAALTIGATVLVGGGAWVIWLSPAAVADRAESLDPSRVAVLYFDDHSPTGELGYVADGLTEALIHELAQIPALEVVSRNGVKPYRNPEVPVDSIARALRAGMLVEGSVEQVGDRLAATVQLIDGRTGAHLLSRRLERTGENVLDLRDAIVEEAAGLLSRALGKELAVERSREETSDPEAWSRVQRARVLMDHADTLRWRLGDVDAARTVLRQADSLLTGAEALDEEWPAPTLMRARVARSRSRLGGVSRQDSDPADLHHAIELVNRVLAADADNPEALALRGSARYSLSWLREETADPLVAAAESDFRAAVEVDPDNAEGWVGLAELLRSRGAFAEASFAAEQALEADPFLIHAERSILFTLAHVWLELEDVERAARWAAEGLRRYPQEPAFPATQLVIMAGWPGATVHVDSAWSLVEAVARSYGSEEWAHGKLQVAAVLVKAGRADSARSLVRRVRSRVDSDPWIDYYEANVRLQLGETDRALALLERFIEATPHRRAYIARDWWWRPLRSELRFRELVRGES